MRELQNVIERAVIISTGPVLSVDVADLKFSKAGRVAKKTTSPKSPINGALHDVLEQSESEQILRALEQCNRIVAGQRGAAAHLGMKRPTLQQRIRKLESYATLRNRAALHLHSPNSEIPTFLCQKTGTLPQMWQWHADSVI